MLLEVLILSSILSTLARERFICRSFLYIDYIGKTIYLRVIFILYTCNVVIFDLGIFWIVTLSYRLKTREATKLARECAQIALLIITNQ